MERLYTAFERFGNWLLRYLPPTSTCLCPIHAISANRLWVLEQDYID